MIRIINLIILATIAIYQIGVAQVDFKVVTYNTLRFPNNTNTTSGGTTADRLAAFQDIMEAMNPDIIIFQELRTVGGTDDLLITLNTSNLSKTFARTPQAPYSNSGTGGNMLFYNTALFSFINENTIPRTNSTLAPDGTTIVQSPRLADIYRLDALSGSSGSPIPIYFISAHLKAGNSSHNSDLTQIPDEDRRALGAKDIMDYIHVNLANTDNVILVGDMNFQDETDEGYIEFNSSSSYTELFYAPLGAWQRDSQSSILKFTQSPRTTGNAVGNGGAGGGLCDRFDFIFYNDDIATANNGLGYKANTMQTFGSTGVNVNQSALSGTHILKQQLHDFSDHYPVVATFTLDPSSVMPTNCTAYSIDMSNVLIEDFANYAGQGFVDNPAPGQLCSYGWDFTGFSDAYSYGGINVGNDYALGSTDGGSSQGGIYDNNHSLWIQPTGSDFTSGSAIMKICNGTGSTIDSMTVGFDIYILNDKNRSNKLDFSYSLNGTSFNILSGMSEISQGPATDAFNIFPKNINLYNLNILPNDCFYLRWTGNDVSGSGSRDEFGIDNIMVQVLQAPPCPTSLTVHNTPIPDGVYQAGTIISMGSVPIGGTVDFEFSDCILLDNGFSAEGNLNITINECGQ